MWTFCRSSERTAAFSKPAGTGNFCRISIRNRGHSKTTGAWRRFYWNGLERQMATSERPKRPKVPAPPIDLDEIERDPGFRGMLSFLQDSPEDRAALLAQRARAEDATALGISP